MSVLLFVVPECKWQLLFVHRPNAIRANETLDLNAKISETKINHGIKGLRSIPSVQYDNGQIFQPSIVRESTNKKHVGSHARSNVQYSKKRRRGAELVVPVPLYLCLSSARRNVHQTPSKTVSPRVDASAISLSLSLTRHMRYCIVPQLHYAPGHLLYEKSPVYTCQSTQKI